MNHVAIIGGSGIYKMEKAQIVEELSVQTPFGRPSSLIKKIRLSDDQEFFFLFFLLLRVHRHILFVTILNLLKIYLLGKFTGLKRKLLKIRLIPICCWKLFLN